MIDTMAKTRTDCEGIEITPEMIEAGVDRLLDYTVNVDSPSAVVRSVLIASLSVGGVHAARRKTSDFRRGMGHRPNGAKSD